MSQQIDDQNLKAAYWYNTHSDLLRNIGYGFSFVVVGIILLVFLIESIQLATIWGPSQRSAETIHESLLNTENIKKPQPLILVDSGVVVGAKPDTVDAYAEIQNPNLFHDAHFEYAITVDGVTQTANDTVIPKNSNGYVILRNYSGDTNSDISVEISKQLDVLENTTVTVSINYTDTTIQRLKTVTQIVTEEPDTDKSGASTVLEDVEAEEPEFVRPEDVEEPTQQIDEKFTALTTTALNDSPVGFREFAVLGIVTNEAGVIQGVHKEVLKDFESFEEQRVQLIWERRFIAGSSGNVYAFPNFIDTDNVILPGE